MFSIKSFLTFLAILVYPTTAFYSTLFPRYFTGVTEGLTCKYRNIKHALIVISKSPTPKLETTFISAKVVPFGRKFYLVGKTKNSLRPFLYFKIIHSCTAFDKNSYKRIYVIGIPKKYIARSRRISLFNVRKIELSKLPGKLVKHAAIWRG
uniref:NTR domain-containing protein n=1 Tax=Strongyloides papillosus TaxID=174720 RepID=A0A0N5BRJ9_STREA